MPCPEGFSPGTSVFLPLEKPLFLNSSSIRIEDLYENQLGRALMWFSLYAAFFLFTSCKNISHTIPFRYMKLSLVLFLRSVVVLAAQAQSVVASVIQEVHLFVSKTEEDM